MTPQPSNAHTNPDTRIDHVLQALRNTQPPAGMEERIAHRLSTRMQQAEARTQPSISGTSTLTHGRASSSFFAVILTLSLPKGKNPRILPAQARIFAASATALALLAALTVLHYRSTTTQPNTTTAFNHEAPRATTTPIRQAFSHETSNIATTQVPQGFSLGSHRAPDKAGVSTPAPTPDLDAIALAETLAPTRAATPLPLTSQKQLIVTAARSGQPIQLAELDAAREPFLQAIEKARTDAAIKRYVHTLLAPFAVADALQPTTFSQPQETFPATRTPQPSN